MTVETNYVIAIATLSDCLKILRQCFNQWEAKRKPIAPCTSDFLRALGKLEVIASNSDWFIALFVKVVISLRNNFGLGFIDSLLKTALI